MKSKRKAGAWRHARVVSTIALQTTSEDRGRSMTGIEGAEVEAGTGGDDEMERKTSGPPCDRGGRVQGREIETANEGTAVGGTPYTELDHNLATDEETEEDLTKAAEETVGSGGTHMTTGISRVAVIGSESGRESHEAGPGRHTEVAGETVLDRTAGA